MASIFKRDGERNYTIAYRDAKGRRREVKGTPDKKTTALIAAKFVNETALRKRGVIDQAHDQLSEAAKCPLSQHLEEFTAHMEARGCSLNHVSCTSNYIKGICNACGIDSIRELTAPRVAKFVNDLRRQGKKAGSINPKLVAVKAFSRWLWRSGRLITDPLAQISRLNAKIDRTYRRRALSDSEAMWLILAAKDGKPLEGVSGPDRAMLYRLALGTGFRANEIRSLTPESFDLDAEVPTVTIEAGYSKHRRRDVQPIRPDLMDHLRPWLKSKTPGKAVLAVGDRTADMLRADLDAARTMWLRESATAEECYDNWGSDFLADKDASDRVVDFHSLRHTFITWLARAGVSPAVAKSLARHSTITLTVDHYTHTLIGDDSAALAKLPDIETQAIAEVAELRATGSDGKVQTVGKTGPQERPQIRPQMHAKSLQSTPTPATIGMMGSAQAGGNQIRPKSIKNRRLTTADQRPPSSTAEKLVVGRAGVEPATHGFSVRCSTN